MIDNFFFFLRKNDQHLFVIAVFVLATLFHYFTFVPEVSKSDKTSKTKLAVESADLDVKHKEKVYSRVFQSQEGDVFRMSAFIRTKEKEIIEIFVRSPLNDLLKIGELSLMSSEQGEYKELVFSTSSRYEDVVVRLKEVPERAGTTWDGSGVYIRSFSVTRLGVKGESEIRSLESTVFGSSKVKQEVLLSKKRLKNSQDRVDWVFQAQGDFLQVVEFTGESIGQGKQEYIFELTPFDQEKDRGGDKILQRTSFTLDALSGLLVSSGNYQLPFLAPLEQGKWYSISLTRKSSNDQRNIFSISSLESDTLGEPSVKGDLALYMLVRSRVKNDASFPDGAKLEDLGKNRLYSFSLENELIDYTNIFDASVSIRFDREKRLVIGSQRSGEFLTYKFDTVFPFDQFALQVTQKGNDEKEIKLEFSFDNAFWKEIPFIQEKGAPQRFIVTLSGDGRTHIIYVRASYNGEEKKSGFFAIEKLLVNASVPKTIGNR